MGYSPFLYYLIIAPYKPSQAIIFKKRSWVPFFHNALISDFIQSGAMWHYGGF